MTLLLPSRCIARALRYDLISSNNNQSTRYFYSFGLLFHFAILKNDRLCIFFKYEYGSMEDTRLKFFKKRNRQIRPVFLSIPIPGQYLSKLRVSERLCALTFTFTIGMSC